MFNEFYSSTLGYRVMYNGKICKTLAGHSFNVGDYVYLPSSLYGICVDQEFYGSVDAAIVEVYSTYEPPNNIAYTGMTVSPNVQAVPVDPAPVYDLINYLKTDLSREIEDERKKSKKMKKSCRNNPFIKVLLNLK